MDTSFDTPMIRAAVEREEEARAAKKQTIAARKRAEFAEIGAALGMTGRQARSVCDSAIRKLRKSPVFQVALQELHERDRAHRDEHSISWADMAEL